MSDLDIQRYVVRSRLKLRWRHRFKAWWAYRRLSPNARQLVDECNRQLQREFLFGPEPPEPDRPVEESTYSE